MSYIDFFCSIWCYLVIFHFFCCNLHLLLFCLSLICLICVNFSIFFIVVVFGLDLNFFVLFCLMHVSIKPNILFSNFLGIHFFDIVFFVLYSGFIVSHLVLFNFICFILFYFVLFWFYLVVVGIIWFYFGLMWFYFVLFGFKLVVYGII